MLETTDLRMLMNWLRNEADEWLQSECSDAMQQTGPGGTDHPTWQDLERWANLVEKHIK